MSRPKKPAVVPFHAAPAGQPADFFARLTEKARGTTRDGKPYYTCTFRDRVRAAAAKVWADAPLFAACEADWQPGGSYKVRAVFSEHEKYGPQLELIAVRDATAADEADGFRPWELSDHSRFDPEVMLGELRQLVAAEIKDEPLRLLVAGLLDAHADKLKPLPAHPRAFHPFPGGWLEHTLSVARTALLLADRYSAYYPELTPPLNRDLVAAGAVLHDLGRVAELAPGLPGQAPDVTVPGQLFGHLLLGRDLVRDAARQVEGLNPDLLAMLEHLIVSHLTKPEWGSPRQPAIPEGLILHHADDLDAKLEMFVRCLTRDAAAGPFTDRDPVLQRPLYKGRTV